MLGAQCGRAVRGAKEQCTVLSAKTGARCGIRGRDERDERDGVTSRDGRDGGKASAECEVRNK